MLTHDGTVLTFHQGIVIAVPGPGFGQFDQELVKQLGDVLVNVFRAIIAMKTQDHKGKLIQECGQHRNQITFTNLLCRTDDFERCDLINGVNVVDAFSPI